MWAIEIKSCCKNSAMPDTFCRGCGTELWEMAACVRCGKAILHGCPRCAIFSDTKLHIACLHQMPMMKA